MGKVVASPGETYQRASHGRMLRQNPETEEMRGIIVWVGD